MCLYVFDAIVGLTALNSPVARKSPNLSRNELQELIRNENKFGARKAINCRTNETLPSCSPLKTKLGLKRSKVRKPDSSTVECLKRIPNVRFHAFVEHRKTKP
ncbi:hypothetical protein P5673_017781 [Acropora cervicornis]|uniref:Uncharacterized protein n=1 Tax=Acropora cervicornis TaxID=6130 RepID=A0AAD9QEA9_ACRCE|nr:hypothetical protein P5673_017781 [Acropora cervicornis]